MVGGISSHDRNCRLCFTSLRGKRHKIRTNTEYRICQSCWIFHHQEEGEDFAEDCSGGFNAPKSLEIHLGWSAELWEGHDHTTTPIDHLEVWLTSGCPGHHWNRFVAWMANQEALRSVHVNVGMAERQTASIQALVAGLQASTCVQVVCLELHLDEFISKAAGKAIQELILDCGSLEHMAIRLSRVESMLSLPFLEVGWFEDLLMDTVATTRLRSFSYYGTWKTTCLEDHNGIQACHAMVHNPYLQQLKIPDRYKNEVALLAANKHHGWSQQWACPQQTRHGDILEQALGFPTSATDNEHWGTTEKDRVSLLYGFLQARPDLLWLESNKLVECLEGVCLPRKRRSKKRRSSKRASMPSFQPNCEEQWYHCWRCQTHILGDTELKHHLKSQHHHKLEKKTKKCCQPQKLAMHQLSKPGESSTSYYCWCCQESIQGEAAWQVHLQSRSHCEPSRSLSSM